MQTLETYLKSIHQLITNSMTIIERQRTPSNDHLTTGLVDLDRMTRGLSADSFTLLTGRRAMGKTSFILNVAMTQIREKSTPVVIFSPKRNAELVFMKLLAANSNIDQTRIRMGRLNDVELNTLSTECRHLAELSNFYIDDTPFISLDEIYEKLCDIKQQHDELGFVAVLDIESLFIRPAASDVITPLHEKCSLLRQISSDLRGKFMATCTLPEPDENQTEVHPKISDIENYPQVCRSVDLILFIHREDAYQLILSRANHISEAVIGSLYSSYSFGFNCRVCYHGKIATFKNYTPVNAS